MGTICMTGYDQNGLGCILTNVYWQVGLVFGVRMSGSPLAIRKGTCRTIGLYDGHCQIFYDFILPRVQFMGTNRTIVLKWDFRVVGWSVQGFGFILGTFGY